jgi:hypothetical protein
VDEIHQVSWAITVVAVLAAGVVAWFGDAARQERHAARRERDKAREQRDAAESYTKDAQQKQATAEDRLRLLDDAARTEIDEQSGVVAQLEEAAKLVGLVKADLASERDRGDRYFRCIETIEKERNQWQEAYDLAASGHATAQQMMMSELGRLSKRMERAKRYLSGEVDAPEAIVRDRDPNEWRIEQARGALDTVVDPRLQAISETYAEATGPEGTIVKGIDRPPLELTAEEAAARVSPDPA